MTDKQDTSAALGGPVRFGGDGAAPDSSAQPSPERLLAGIPAAVFTVDKDHRVLSWNRRAEELTGYPASEIIGEKCSIFMTGGCETDCSLFGDRALPPLISCVCSIRRKDGEIRVIELNADVLRDENGRVTGGVETFTDITDRKHAGADGRAALAELEERVAERTLRLEKINAALEREINGRRYVEQSLKIREALSRGIYDRSPVMLHSLNEECEIVDVNQRWLRTLGYDAVEVIGKRFVDFVAPEGRNHIRNAILPRLLNSGAITDIPCRILKKNGEVVDVNWSEVIETDDQGGFLRSLAVLADVTEKRRAEVALRHSEERYRRIFNSMIDGYMVVDPEGRIVSANPAAVRILGHVRERSMISQSARELFFADPADEAEVLSLLKKGQVLENHRLELQKADRTVIRADCNIQYVRDEFRHPAAVEYVFRDATRRISAELEYRTILKTALDGFLLCSASDGAIIEANDALAEMYGYDRSEILSLSIADLESEESGDQVAEHMRRIIRNGSDRFESVHQKKDGTRIDVHVSVRYLNVRGGAFVAFFRDITGKKAADRAIAESEEKFRTLFNEATDAIFVSGVDDARIRDCNEAAARLTGKSRDRLIGSNLIDLHPEEDRTDEFTGALRDCMEDCRGRLLEARIIGPGGDVRHVTIKANRFELRGRSLVQGIYRDITERKLAEEALAKTEARFRAIFESTTDGIMVWDRDHRFLYANRAVIDRLGLDAGSIIGEPVLSGLGHIPDIATAWEECIEQVLAGGEPLLTEDVFTIKGRMVTLESTVFPISGLGGEVFAVGGVSRDLTHKRDMARRIGETLYLNQKIINASSMGLLAFRRDGRCILANEAACRIVGAPQETVLRQNFHEIDSWRRSGLLSVAKAVMEDGAERRMDVHMVTTFGKEVWLECHLSRFEMSAEARLLLIINDILERKRMEDRLTEQNEALERSNRELDDFAYIASHDLREPLRGIAGYSRLMIEDYADRLDEEGQGYLDTLVRLCEREENLIESLLHYSRVGRTELSIRDTDLTELVRDVVEGVNLVYPGENIRIEVEEPLPTLRCDEVRVREVFYNLITNAIKYNVSPEKHITIGWDEKIPGPEGGTAGAPLKAARVFRVASEPGKGTTFFFTLEPDA